MVKRLACLVVVIKFRDRSTRNESLSREISDPAVSFCCFCAAAEIILWFVVRKGMDLIETGLVGVPMSKNQSINMR